MFGTRYIWFVISMSSIHREPGAFPLRGRGRAHELLLEVRGELSPVRERELPRVRLQVWVRLLQRLLDPV